MAPFHDLVIDTDIAKMWLSSHGYQDSHFLWTSLYNNLLQGLFIADLIMTLLALAYGLGTHFQDILYHL